MLANYLADAFSLAASLYLPKAATVATVRKNLSCSKRVLGCRQASRSSRHKVTVFHDSHIQQKLTCGPARIEHAADCTAFKKMRQELRLQQMYLSIPLFSTKALYKGPGIQLCSIYMWPFGKMSLLMAECLRFIIASLLFQGKLCFQ